VETVLGLSITSTSVAWVLVDTSAADGPALDHDAFDVDAKTDTTQHAVAVRGAQAIAAATGHVVRSIGVTWTDDVEAEARQLLESLREGGYDNLIEVPLSTAAHAWVQGFGGDPGPEMPVISSAEAQVALARGAAMAVANADIADQPVDEGPAEDDPPHGQSKPASHAMLAMLTAGVLAVGVALTYQVHTDGSTGG
jgi:membrane-associated phospholipid phosphatase